ELLPNVVGMPAHDAVGPIAQVRGHGGPRADRIRNVARLGGSMTDAYDDVVSNQGFDILCRFGPLWRHSHQANAAFRRALPTAELVDIRRTYPLPRMGAARAVVGRDVRTLDVKS